jgi:Insulin-induced protein (INSIG)
MEMPQIHRPIPRRTFEITPASSESSHPPSPVPEFNPDFLTDRRNDNSFSQSRTRSVLNLTASTLFGIYSGTGTEGSREEMSTPWGTGAQTPSHRRSMDDYSPDASRPVLSEYFSKPPPRPRKRRTGFKGYYGPLAMQTTLLFGFGVAYGSIVTHLQESRKITPIPVPGVKQNSASYHVSWGLIGVLLGNALPLVDHFWQETFVDDASGKNPRRPRSSSDQIRASLADGDLGPIWYSAVRSIGAFVGIAFAVVSLVLDLLYNILTTLNSGNFPGSQLFRFL